MKYMEEIRKGVTWLWGKSVQAEGQLGQKCWCGCGKQAGVAEEI